MGSRLRRAGSGSRPLRASSLPTVTARCTTVPAVRMLVVTALRGRWLPSRVSRRVSGAKAREGEYRWGARLACVPRRAAPSSWHRAGVRSVGRGAGLRRVRRARRLGATTVQHRTSGGRTLDRAASRSEVQWCREAGDFVDENDCSRETGDGDDMATPSMTTPATVLRTRTVSIDQRPALVYLARLSHGSRRTMGEALGNIARLLSGGRCDAETLDWAALRYQHTAAVRTALLEAVSAEDRPGAVRRHREQDARGAAWRAARGVAAGPDVRRRLSPRHRPTDRTRRYASARAGAHIGRGERAVRHVRR